MALTTLNTGNAIGMAFLIAIINSELQGKTGQSLQTDIASGARTAFYLAAAGLVLGVLVALFLPRKK
jgi:FtsH-binding integral membrane protein